MEGIVINHKKKRGVDRKILKEFRKLGWIEKITHYSHELKKPKDFLKREYILRYNKLTSQVRQVFHVVPFTTHICKMSGGCMENLSSLSFSLLSTGNEGQKPSKTYLNNKNLTK